MAGWNLECLTVGPLQMNAWLLVDPASGEAALIDPGDHPTRLLARLDAAGARLRWLLATHGHFDHIAAAVAIQAHRDLPLLIHPADAFLVAAMPDHQRAFGLPPTPVPRIETSLLEGRELPLGSGALTVTEVPGHSPGQVMFTWPGHAIVGDCIFAGSVGRTDLPGGDLAALEASIRERIYTLPDVTVIHPGHGPDTTVGREKATNPFVAGR
ncbi:MAG TPA: MBL fold metallo-hydrolase [Candidatus Krumholzibacteria bacterium]|nr:MBL fold metallo-hydrolase [Candidatus Krumholzibacteria bacterium]HPD71501.1 MBL fold metallo-hydrolase [Candidatus Krumholzibacteria bacterium]HRY41566.1 MBL fold metallo-hydrolase [Candidatus Krumholzibacteria bacterium]